MLSKWYVMRSTRGLERPWIVFSPSERRSPHEEQWRNGFATWTEAIESIRRRLTSHV